MLNKPQAYYHVGRQMREARNRDHSRYAFEYSHYRGMLRLEQPEDKTAAEAAFKRGYEGEPYEVDDLGVLAGRSR